MKRGLFLGLAGAAVIAPAIPIAAVPVPPAAVAAGYDALAAQLSAIMADYVDDKIFTSRMSLVDLIGRDLC